MKHLFPHFHPLTDDELSNLWKHCVFVFDANVLLDLYRYKPETSETLLATIEFFSERIWMPHQFAYEYSKNRVRVLNEQRTAYEKIEEILNESLSALEKDIKSSQREHPYLRIEGISQVIRRLKKRIEKQRQNHPDWTRSDPIADKLDQLFYKKVGDEYPPQRLEEIYQGGEKRYDMSQPPGYMDKKDKKGNEKYGDLVAWFQMLDYAKQEKRPIVLVTRDKKRDWWWIEQGKTVGPRPELRKEMLQVANVEFHLYLTERFMHYAQQYTQENLDEAIDEVKKLREYDTTINTENPRYSAPHYPHVLPSTLTGVGSPGEVAQFLVNSGMLPPVQDLAMFKDVASNLNSAYLNFGLVAPNLQTASALGLDGLKHAAQQMASFDAAMLNNQQLTFSGRKPDDSRTDGSTLEGDSDNSKTS